MSAPIEVAKQLVPFVIFLARSYMQKQAEKGGITQSEAALLAVFDAVVTFLDSQKGS